MSWRLKSSATGLFLQQLVRADNIKALHHRPFWVRNLPPGTGCFPLKRANKLERAPMSWQHNENIPWESSTGGNWGGDGDPSSQGRRYGQLAGLVLAEPGLLWACFKARAADVWRKGEAQKKGCGGGDDRVAGGGGRGGVFSWGDNGGAGSTSGVENMILNISWNAGHLIYRRAL